MEEPMGAEKDKNPATGLRECHYGTLQNYRLKRSRKTVGQRSVCRRLRTFFKTACFRTCQIPVYRARN